MPLHRNIHWIGRQWAVTGHGMQLIDQKLQGFFDIEIARLWDEALIESVHAKEWVNTADFDKGLVLARARYPQAPGAVKPIERKPEPAKFEIPKPVAPPLTTLLPVESPRAAVAPPVAVVPPGQAAPRPPIEPAAPPPPVARPVEPKPGPARLETAKRETAKAVAPALAARAPVETPIAATPSRQAAPAPVIEPVPPAAKPTERKPKVLKLGAPEPATVTLHKRRSAEPPPAAPPAVVMREQPRPAPTREKPAAVELPRATGRIDVSAIATRIAAEPPTSLFQMRYQCHARFVRAWRVVTKRPT